MPVNTPKNQKTNGSLSNFFVDDSKKNRKKDELERVPYIQ